MRLLLDTHILLWAAGLTERLPVAARTLIEDRTNLLHFSAASIWEVAIKSGLGRQDFVVNPGSLHRSLLANDYAELDVTGAHAVAVDLLPRIHRDPFDRLLVAQAQVEGLTLLTSDEVVGRYPGDVRLISAMPGGPGATHLSATSRDD